MPEKTSPFSDKYQEDYTVAFAAFENVSPVGSSGHSEIPQLLSLFVLVLIFHQDVSIFIHLCSLRIDNHPTNSLVSCILMH